MCSEELAKIDLLRSRTEIGYQEAKELLDVVNGDIVQALIKLEERDKNERNGFSLKKWLLQSWKTKIRINQDGQTVLELPLVIGALGLLGVLTRREIVVLEALLGVAALAKNYTLEIDFSEKEVPFTKVSSTPSTSS